MNKNLNSELHQMYEDDKLYKNRLHTTGESDCCNAPVYGDIMICSDCNDNCEYKPKLCAYCGDVEVDENNIVCCKSCWSGYASETFYQD
jgi:hypothetical protein|tara:strand:- start:77 stop:343 length:267 start_codon:yes stop_codon:yes gene_type:complete